MTQALASTLTGIGWVVLAYFLLVNTAYAATIVAAHLEARRQLRATRLESLWVVLGSSTAPSISVVAPAHNEAASVVASVRSLLALSYPRLEVVVVNDGSTDLTVEALQRAFRLFPVHPAFETRTVRGLYRTSLHPNLVVVDKERGGKADALNVGLEAATGDLVCAIDADTLVEPDALMRMVRPFLADESLLAAGGTIRVVNDCRLSSGSVVVAARTPRRPLPGMQVVEYLRAFLFGRLGLNRLGGNLIVSGAFGLFRRDAMLATGGYQHDTVGEDMELVVRLRRWAREGGRPDRVEFVPDPVAWTEVPESLRGLGRQRERWHRGLADALWRHRRLLLNARYGALGMFVVPYFWLVELLAPLVELVGLATVAIGVPLGLVDTHIAILLFVVAYGWGVLLTVVTLLLEEVWYHRSERLRDRFLLMGWALLEPLGYRQMTVLWRVRGLVRFVMRRSDWAAMERRGFVTPAPVRGGIEEPVAAADDAARVP